MKLTKIAGAFALTAAMAMSAVPAFAAATADNTDIFKAGADGTTATQSTKVMAELVNVDLNATIPTRVAVVLPSNGLGDITCPTSDVYKIVNKGASNIQLTAVTASSTTFTLATQLTTTSSSTPNTLAMKVTPEGGSAVPLTADASLENPITIAANNGELPLLLSGKSYITGSGLSSQQLDSAIMTINYTIGKANA